MARRTFRPDQPPERIRVADTGPDADWRARRAEREAREERVAARLLREEPRP